MEFPVFDLHCDTSLALLGSDLTQAGSLLKNSGHFDLTRAGEYPAFTQCFSCYTTPQMATQYHKSPITVFELELATILREVSKNEKQISIAYQPSDIIYNAEHGRISAVLTIEGPAGFDYDPELLEDLYKIGFRMTTLGWNESNPLCGSHITGEGLSDMGREYVKQAQSLGILVDVSHCSDRAFWDMLAMTDSPIIASHSNSRHVCNHSRNITDDMFLAICETGGVVGINFYQDFIGGNGDLNRAVDHVMHFLELDPAGHHIALGADLDGCDRLAVGFDGVQSYCAFADAMLVRGISRETVMNIFWNNALGVFEYAVRHNTK